MILAASYSFLIISIFIVGYFTLKSRYFLSPTNIFLLYGCLAYPVSFFICVIFDFDSVFFNSSREIEQVSLFVGAFWYFIGLLIFVYTRFFGANIRVFRYSNSRVKVSSKKILILGVFSAIAFVISVRYLLSVLGGLENTFEQLGSIRAGGLSGLGLYTYAINMLIPTIAQLYLIYRLHNNMTYQVTLIVCILLAFTGFIFGFRGPVIALLIQIYVIVFYYTGKPTRRQLIFSSFFIFPMVIALDLSRFLSFEDISVFTSVNGIGETIMNSTFTRVRALETFAVLHESLSWQNYGYYIDTILELFKAIIPSQVIEKGPSVAQIIATEYYSSYLYNEGIFQEVYGGVAYGYLAQNFWNLGYLGIIIFPALLGVMLKNLENSHSGKSIIFVIVNKTVAGFMFLIVESPQLGLNAILLGLFVNIMLFITVIKYRF